METYFFGKRKREWSGAIITATTGLLQSGNPISDSSCLPQTNTGSQSRSQSNHKNSRISYDYRRCDQQLAQETAGRVIGFAQTSTNSVTASSEYAGYDSSSTRCFSPFASSEDDTGTETCSDASTSGFIDGEVSEQENESSLDSKPKAMSTATSMSLPYTGTSQFVSVGSDVMVSVVKFLEPAEALRLLTTPLCREWRHSYTANQDMWRTLCCEDPFSAKLTRNSGAHKTSQDSLSDSQDDCDDDSFCSLADNDDESIREGSNHVLGEYRLLYTSFVRCMNYLNRIQEEARNGQMPSVFDHGNGYSRFPTFGVTKSLKQFLANPKNGSLKSVIGDGSGSFRNTPAIVATANTPIGVVADDTPLQTSDCTKTVVESKDSTKPKYGRSMITDRLFGPTADGTPSHLNLPASCAIYSIVNWMVAHPEVEGIQTMCVCSLPALLEDEQQRVTAQRVGLIEVILCGMLRFPHTPSLHISAFHSIVLLARPIGGREGMLFDNSMADSAQSLDLTPKARYGRIFTSALDRHKENVASMRSTCQPARSAMNGVSILIASMERFKSNEKLQAMACWAMVNLALVPAQKAMLIGLNGIQAATSAMRIHPESFDVQYRALFALINLVVPSGTLVSTESSDTAGNQNHTMTEKDVLDTMAPGITELVVRAMKNFCSNETILNRACLVLHNLSQTPDFITVLVWTPQCYQMLEWCRANYPTDSVLQRSASSTLGRIQAYLSQRREERRKFVQTLQRERQSQQERLNVQRESISPSR